MPLAGGEDAVVEISGNKLSGAIKPAHLMLGEACFLLPFRNPLRVGLRPCRPEAIFCVLPSLEGLEHREALYGDAEGRPAK